MADDKKLLQAACDYINKNWAELHNRAKEYAAEVKVDDIVSSRVDDDTLVMVVDRDTLGSPKYHLSLAGLEKMRVSGKLNEPSDFPRHYEEAFDYSSLTVAEINELPLDTWSVEEVEALEALEAGNKARSSVLKLIAGILTKDESE